MKNLDVAVGRWWRWTHYEIRDGYIRPGSGACLITYDPWDKWLSTRPPAKSSNQRRSGETPYQSLLRLLGELQYRRPGDEPLDFKPAEVDLMLAPFTEDSEAKLLEWCARYGLLGLLLHRTVQVTLAPRIGVQIQYTKIGAGWITTERPVTRKQPFSIPGAILQPLRGAGPVAESLSTTWSRFFRDVPHDQRETFSYPEPFTKKFWEQYAEPVADFLSGMHALRELHQAVRLFQDRSAKTRRLRKLRAAIGSPHLAAEGLTAGVGLALEWNRARHLQLKWVGSSLLASLAVMMLEDLTYGRALQCPGCGRPFVSGAYQARFCSERCRWAVQKREYRQSREPST